MMEKMGVLSRLLVWAKLARLAWDVTRNGYKGWDEAGTDGAPGATFVTVSPTDAGPSATNPVYAFSPERCSLEIDVEMVDITTPADKARVYREGEYGVYMVGFARPGSRTKLVRHTTDGGLPARVAARKAAGA